MFAGLGFSVSFTFMFHLLIQVVNLSIVYRNRLFFVLMKKKSEIDPDGVDRG